MKLSIALAAVVLVSSSSAFAIVPWVDRYGTCREALADQFAQTTPVLYSLPADSGAASLTDPTEQATRKAWGFVDAIHQTSDGKESLWLIGNGNTYIAELPPPTINNRVPELGEIRIWKVRIVTAGRPPLIVDIHSYKKSRDEAITVMSDLSGKYKNDKSYEDVANVSARVEVSPAVKKQSADTLVRVLEHNKTMGAPTTDQIKALAACKSGLDNADPDDNRVALALGDYLTSSDTKVVERPSMRADLIPCPVTERTCPQAQLDVSGTVN